MDRKTFLNTILKASIGMLLLPRDLFHHGLGQLPYEQLIGKGNPELFGNSYKLRKEAHEALLAMSEAALESDIQIEVVSSYRGFSHQNRIWERKYKLYKSYGLSPEERIQKIIEYSTIPGTSRHHWGTDVDLIDAKAKRPARVLQPEHFEGNGCFSAFKSWMDEHANRFEFYLVYTDRANRKGFKYEPWHYSYKPLSQSYLKAYRQLDIKSIISSERLLGNEYFSDEFIAKYLNENILDINPELL